MTLGIIKKLLWKKNNQTIELPGDLEKEFVMMYQQCRKYTMVNVEGLYANYQAVKYIVDNNIQGAIVECGVWKGGSIMMMLLTLLKKSCIDREVYLYDTYTGMPKPEGIDKKRSGNSAIGKWQSLNKETFNLWCYAPLDEVRKNVESTRYPINKLHYIKGKVETTIPDQAPDKIALMRIDTDWYKSTYHELWHLYPRLEKNGVLIIDDYGSWEGARKAVDQYFAEEKINPLASRIDSSRRLVIKT